jgi:GAF domain-containing protein/nitrogen-specific signal transduction histidine kinase
MTPKNMDRLRKEVESQLKVLCKQFGADSATFHLYDAERGQFLFPLGINLKHPEQFVFLPSPRGPAARILDKGIPLFENNVEDNPQFRGPFTLREGVKSGVGFPLLGQAQKRIGIIFLNFTVLHTFSEDEKDGITKAVGKISAKIFGWLTDDLWQELRKEEGLLEEQYELRQIAGRVRDVLSNSEVAIWLLERREKQEALVLNAYAGFEGFPGSILGEAILVNRADHFLVRAFHSKGEVEVSAFSDDQFHQKGASKRPWHSAWAFPISQYGVLVVYRFVPGKLTENELSIGRAFADQARVTSEAYQRIHDLEVLSRVGKNLNLAVDPVNPNELLQKIVTEAAQLTKADRVVLLPYNQSRNEFLDVRNYAVTYPLEEKILEQPRPGGASENALEHGSMIVPDVDALPQNDPRVHSASFEIFHLKAAYDIRLKADNEVVGILMFNYLNPHQFTRNESAVFSLFADYAASAIRNERLIAQFREGNENLKVLNDRNELLVTQLKERNDILKVLNDIGNALSSRVDLTEDRICEEIYIQAQKHIDEYVNMYIALYDEDTDEVRFGLVVEKGEQLSKENFLPNSQSGFAPRRGGQGKTEELIHTRQQMFHRTRDEVESWYKQGGKKEYLGQVSSCWMGVPMLVGDRVIGVLAAFHPDQDNAYADTDFQFLDAMANQAALALENSRLYKEQQQLFKISQALASESDLEKVLYQITARAKELLKADLVTIYQYSEDNREFYLPTTGEMPLQSLPSKTGVVSQIVSANKPIFAENVLSDSLLGASRFARDQKIVSCAATPLLYSGNCIGVLLVNYIEPHKFTDHYKMIFPLVADSAAVAINMAGRLYETTRQLKTVLQSIEAVRECDTLDDLLITYLRFALDAIHAESGTIQLLESELETLTVRAVHGNVSQREYERVSLDRGITGHAARNKHSIYVPDVTTDPDYLGLFGGTHSELAVPFLVNGELLGVLNAEHSKEDAFGSNERRLFELFVLIRERLRLDESHRKQTKAEVDLRASEMTYNIMHHIKNYLGSGRLYLEKVEKHKGTPAEQLEIIHLVDANMKRCIGIAESLYKPYRSTGRIEVSASLLINNAVSSLSIPPNVKLDVSIPGDLPKVFIETNNAVANFLELLTNALRMIDGHINAGKITQGKIEILGQLGSDGQVELHFINNGPPIPMEQKDLIFEQFSGLSRKDVESKHFGLGLWGARTFFRRQGCDIYVLKSDESQTVFVVKLLTAHKIL